MKFTAIVTCLAFTITIMATPGVSQDFVHPVFSGILNGDAGFDKNETDFDILSALIKYANFSSQFSAGSNLTLLAPTDAAFMRASMALGSVTQMNETNAYDAIMNTVVSGMNVDGEILKGQSLVKILLSYHIIGGRALTSSFSQPGFMLTTLFLPIFVTPSGEITDLSPPTPNAHIMSQSVYESDGLLVNALDSVIFPFPVTEESFMQCNK